MSVLILPNAFKGSLTNVEVCSILKEEIQSMHPKASVTAYPFSDGGNNMIESYLSLYPDAEVVHCGVRGPDLGQIVNATYLIHNGIAYIESAKACGILLSEKRNPFKASSYGLGQLILSALSHSVKEIRIGLGGSATNDGGTGMLKALGVDFRSRKIRSFTPVGGSLAYIDSIDIANMDPRLKNVRFTVLSDVENPLLGKKGASYVFAPQKGCDRRSIHKLESGMQNYAKISQTLFGVDKSMEQGAGAAGGIGYAMLLFLNAKIVSGADHLLDTPPLRTAIQNCSTIITGEGHLDSQTLNGKGISKIISAGKGKNILILAGKLDKSIADSIAKKGNVEIYSLNNHIARKTMEEKRQIASSSLRSVIQKAMLEHKDFFI